MCHLFGNSFTLILKVQSVFNITYMYLCCGMLQNANLKPINLQNFSLTSQIKPILGVQDMWALAHKV